MRRLCTGLLGVFATVLLAGSSLAQDLRAAAQWPSDKAESLKEDHPYTWHFYERDGTILLLDGRKGFQLLRRIFSAETQYKAPPDTMDSVDYLDDAIGNIERYFGATCGRCETLEDKAAFVDPWVTRVFAAMHYVKDDTGRSRLAIKPDTDIAHDAILAFADLDREFEKQRRDFQKQSFRAWMRTHSDRIQVIDNETYKDAAAKEGVSFDWAVNFSLAPGGILNSVPFFDGAFIAENRERYTQVIRLLDRHYNIGPDGAVDLRSEYLDGLFTDTGVYFGEWYLQRMRCNAEGKDNKFRRAMYTTATETDDYPENYRRFKGIDVRELRLDARRYRNLLRLYDAGLVFSRPKPEMLDSMDKFMADQSAVVAEHWEFQPRIENMQLIDGVHFWKYADCGASGFCDIRGIKLEDPKDLTSKPLYWVIARFPKSQGTDFVTSDPYGSNDVLSHFSRGSCGITYPRVIIDDMRQDRIWARYDGSVDVDSFRSIHIAYGPDGGLDRIDRFYSQDGASLKLRDLPRLTAETGPGHRAMMFENNMLSGTLTHVIEREKYKSPGFFDPYTMDSYFFDVLKRFQLKFDSSETLGIAFPEDADIIVEMDLDRNMPHGPIKAWSYENGRKGILLAEGRFDHAKPIKTPR